MAGHHKGLSVIKILVLLLLCTCLMQQTYIKTTLFNFLFSNISKQPNIKSKFQSQPFESPFVLSFSLFGDNWELYGSGVERVAATAFQSNFYHNWSIHLCHDGKMLNEHLMSSLKDKYSNIFFYDIRSLMEYGNVSFINGMTWRFLAAGDSKEDVICSRDLDSPILSREEDAVREWLNSGKLNE